MLSPKLKIIWVVSIMFYWSSVVLFQMLFQNARSFYLFHCIFLELSNAALCVDKLLSAVLIKPSEFFLWSVAVDRNCKDIINNGIGHENLYSILPLKKDTYIIYRWIYTRNILLWITHKKNKQYSHNYAKKCSWNRQKKKLFHVQCRIFQIPFVWPLFPCISL